MEPRIREVELTIEDLCGKLYKRELLDFISNNFEEYEGSHIAETAEKMKVVELINVIETMCRDNPSLIEKLRKNVKNVVYEKITNRMSYSIFICLADRKVVKKTKELDYTSRIPTIDKVKEMMESNSVNLEENKSGFMLTGSDIHRVVGRYYYINEEPVLDVERLVYLYYSKVTDMEFSFRNPDPIFCVEDSRPWIIKSFNSIVSDYLETFLHPVGIFNLDNSTEIIMDYYDEIISDIDLFKNEVDFRPDVRSVELDFRGSRTKLKWMYTKGQDVLHDPTIRDLMGRGARVIGLGGKMYYHSLPCEYWISSRRSQSYITVKRLARKMNREQMQDLLNTLINKYLERLPDQAFGR